MSRRYSSDPAATRERITEMGRYAESEILGQDGLVCGKAGSCRSSVSNRDTASTMWEGQMSHIGLHYDMFVDDKPWRVMALGMEIGRGPAHISLEDRRLDQDRAINKTMGERNPHMRGTMTAIRLAYDGAFGIDRAGELLHLENDDQYHHGMECYSLVNKRLCSVTKPGTTDAVGIAALDKNCMPHLQETIRILEPTLCIVQSEAVRKFIRPMISNSETIDPNLGNLEYCNIAGVDTIVATFSHPAARQHLAWGGIKRSDYIAEVVEPTIAAAVKFGLS